MNGETGIYGRLSHLPVLGDPVPVAMKQQVKTGRAQILTTIDGTEPELYDIEIDQVRFNDSSPTRNMVIVITDERLLAGDGRYRAGNERFTHSAGRQAGRRRHARLCERTHQGLRDIRGKHAQNGQYGCQSTANAGSLTFSVLSQILFPDSRKIPSSLLQFIPLYGKILLYFGERVRNNPGTPGILTGNDERATK